MFTGLHSPHYGNSFAVDAQQVVYAGGAIHAGHSSCRIGQAAGRSGRKTYPAARTFHGVGAVFKPFRIDNRIKVYKKNIELTEQLIADIKAKQKEEWR